MPTLLDLCGIPIPEHVEGTSLLSKTPRPWLYGECSEGDHSTRMLHDGRFKLIYYATGNAFQLFDLGSDPRELTDLANSAEHAQQLAKMKETLASQLYGGDLEWLQDGTFVGLPNKTFRLAPHQNLNSQRGDGWPPSPPVDIPQVEWHRNTHGEEQSI